VASPSCYHSAVFRTRVGSLSFIPLETQTSVPLPLPYIRPFGSKCFAGGFAPVSRFGLQSKELTGTGCSAGISHPQDGGTASSNLHSMFKTPERKEFPSHQAGALADSRPIMFDAKNGQMVSRNQSLPQTVPICELGLVRYSGHSSDLPWTISLRRGSGAAECGGLLTPMDHFAIRYKTQLSPFASHQIAGFQFFEVC